MLVRTGLTLWLKQVPRVESRHCYVGESEGTQLADCGKTVSGIYGSIVTASLSLLILIFRNRLNPIDTGKVVH